MRKLVSSPENSEIENWQQLLQVWSSTFDQVFAQTFGLEDALQVRGKFLNTAINFRKQQQKLMEVLLNWNDLPTRREVDEIHRNIYELRKEMKILKKAFASQKQENN